MIAIDMEMPYMCRIGKNKDCPLMDDDDCKLLPESNKYRTLTEQYEHCPLIDLTQYEDDGR